MPHFMIPHTIPFIPSTVVDKIVSFYKASVVVGQTNYLVVTRRANMLTAHAHDKSLALDWKHIDDVQHTMTSLWKGHLDVTIKMPPRQPASEYH